MEVNNELLNLKAAVEREKFVQVLDGHRNCTNCVVTFRVIRGALKMRGR